mmetsp:Transcript_40506/g.60652  ORF Transcript_40506/g.60652 Transcript_40506/m.60652 type:complete len:81 (+) Transcript_40506:463-705(+)
MRSLDVESDAVAPRQCCKRKANYSSVVNAVKQPTCTMKKKAAGSPFPRPLQSRSSFLTPASPCSRQEWPRQWYRQPPQPP